MPKLLDVFKQSRKQSKKVKKNAAAQDPPPDAQSSQENDYVAAGKRIPPPTKPKPASKHQSYLNVELKNQGAPKSSPRSILKKFKSPDKSNYNPAQLDDQTVLKENTRHNRDLFIPKDSKRESLHEIMRGVSPPSDPPPLSPTEMEYEDVNLELPELRTDGLVRELIIYRQPKIGFGFNLARDTYVDHNGIQREVVTTEPGKAHTGVKSGDRILEINARSVENYSRAEVTRLIQESSDTLHLKLRSPPPKSRNVVPQPRQSVTNGNNHLQHLHDTSSLRSRSTESLTNTSPGSARWLVHKDGFTACSIMDTTMPAEEHMSLRCRVKIDRTGHVMQVDEDALEKKNSPDQDLVEDLCSLVYLNEPALLHVLRYRNGAGLIHTSAGAGLIVMDTNQQSNAVLYSNKMMTQVRTQNPKLQSPHIYSSIEQAYRELIDSRKPQSVVYVGHSGSGKTTSLRHSLLYLANSRSVKKYTSSVVEKLGAVFTLLDSFGNCQTSNNEHASRYSSLLVQSQFSNHNLQLSSLYLQCGSLDRSRLFSLSNLDTSYHIVGYILYGADENLRRELLLDQLITNHHSKLVIQTMSQQYYRERPEEFEKTDSAIKTLGVTEDELKSVYYMLAAVLHLTAAQSVKGGTGKWQFERPQYAQNAADMLGCTSDELNKAVFSNSTNMNNSLTLTRGMTMNSSVDSTLNSGLQITGQHMLNSFISALYQEIFNHIILIANRSLTTLNTSTASNLTLTLVDVPGLQTPDDSSGYAGFDDLLINYSSERIQQLVHDKVFNQLYEKYVQENVVTDLEEVVESPKSMIELLDKCSSAQLLQMQTSMSSRVDLSLFADDSDEKGLFWLLDEQSMNKQPSEHYCVNQFVKTARDNTGQLLTYSSDKPLQFTLNHSQGSKPVTYELTEDWLISCRELPASRQVPQILNNSTRASIIKSYSSADETRSTTLRRAGSIRSVTASKMAALKKRSRVITHKLQMDNLIEMLSRTRLHFIFNLSPAPRPLTSNGIDSATIHVPHIRDQIRSHELLLVIRHYRQGYPVQMSFSDFIRSYQRLLTDTETQSTDQRAHVELIMNQFEIDQSLYNIALSQIFLRQSAKVELDERKFKLHAKHAITLQKYLRRYLAKKLITKLRLKQDTISCIQKNTRHYFTLKHWAWWKLFVQIKPLISVKQSEDSVRDREAELVELRSRCERLEGERSEFKKTCIKLEDELSVLQADYNQEKTTASHATELLEQETSQRMSVEQQVQELQEAFEASETVREELSQQLDQVDYNRHYDSDEDLGTDSVTRAKYDRMMSEQKFKRAQLENELNEKIESLSEGKHRLEIKLKSVNAECQELSTHNSSLKKKVQKLTEESQDIKRSLDDSRMRVNELEKKQRRFDNELHLKDQGILAEKQQKEKLQREREDLLVQKYHLNQQLDDSLSEKSGLESKIRRLEHEMAELRTASGGGDTESLALRSVKHELERRVMEQEEEISDMQQEMHELEMKNLKAQMEMDKLRQRQQREAANSEKEIEEIRAEMSSKLKRSENKVESLEDELHEVQLAKKDTDRRLMEQKERATQPSFDPEREYKLKSVIRKLKALLADAQRQLEKNDSNSQKLQLRALETQLEDDRSNLLSAMKSKKSLETELVECQQQLSAATRGKSEAEDKLARANREKMDAENERDDLEEEMNELLKRYQVNVTQTTSSATTVKSQSEQINSLQSKNNQLQEELDSLTARINHLEQNYIPRQDLVVLETKSRENEQKLDYERSLRTRFESQITRLKDNCERLEDDLSKTNQKLFDEDRRNKSIQVQLNRALEDSESSSKREIEQSQQLHHLNQRIEFIESENTQLQSNLKSSNKRIEHLKQALEQDTMSDLDDEYDSEDSDCMS